MMIIFLISLFSGFIPIGGILSFQRTLAYLFTFMLGVKWNHREVKEKIKNMKISNYTIITVNILVVIGVVLAIRYFKVPINIFYNNSPYIKSFGSYSGGFLIRGINFILAAMMTVIFFYMTNDKKSILTKMGQLSLYIYLAHTFIIDFMKIVAKNILTYMR